MVGSQTVWKDIQKNSSAAVLILNERREERDESRVEIRRSPFSLQSILLRFPLSHLLLVLLILDVVSIRGLVWSLGSEVDGVARDPSGGDGEGSEGKDGDEGEGGEGEEKPHGWWLEEEDREANSLATICWYRKHGCLRVFVGWLVPRRVAEQSLKRMISHLGSFRDDQFVAEFQTLPPEKLEGS